MRVSTSRAEAPGLMAEKLAHAANRAGSSSARQRENIVFMTPPVASAAIVIHPEDFLEPLRGSDRPCGPVEEHVEEHRILLLVAPGPHLFVARAEHHDLPGLAEQPRSEEHTSELQSHLKLVCRLLLEK